MNVDFDERFAKDLRSIRSHQLLQRIEAVLKEVEQAKTPGQIRNLKQLKGPANYFRIRIGEYRLGLVMERGTLTFVRCLHRREVYRYFP